MVIGISGVRYEWRWCGDRDVNVNVVVELEIGVVCFVCQLGYERICFSYVDRCMEEGLIYQC